MLHVQPEGTTKYLFRFQAEDWYRNKHQLTLMLAVMARQLL